MSLVMDLILQHVCSELHLISVLSRCAGKHAGLSQNLQAGHPVASILMLTVNSLCRMAGCSLELEFAVTGFQLRNEKIYVLLRCTLQVPKHEAVEECNVGTNTCVARVQ